MVFSKAFRWLVFPVFIAGLFLSTPLKGQVNDAGLWTSFSFEAKVVKKLTANIEQGFRFNENITELGTIYTETILAYKLNKHFQVSGGYRFILKRQVEDYYSYANRFSFFIKYEKKLKPYQFQIRSSLQDQYSDNGRAPDGGIPVYYWRNKLSLSRDIDKPYSPYISVELFSPLNYPRTCILKGVRIASGVEYAVTKHHKIDAYYMIQKELNVSDPKTDFILGFGYSYKL
jgi:hypothetical protein